MAILALTRFYQPAPGVFQVVHRAQVDGLPGRSVTEVRCSPRLFFSRADVSLTLLLPPITRRSR